MEKGDPRRFKRHVAANRAAIAPPSRRRHSDVPCAAERPTRTMSRGISTTGDLPGVAARVVTFLCVAKEKSLATARRAEELP